MMRLAVLVALTFALAGCAQPTTLSPKATPQEIAAEKAMQEKNVYNQDFSALYRVPMSRQRMREKISEAAIRIGPEAVRLCRQLRDMGDNPKRRCVFDVELGKTREGFNAHADGDTVVMGPKLVQLISDKPEQLAFVMAHEFGHNIMQHRDDMQQNGIAGALLGSLIGATVNPRDSSYTQTGTALAQLSFSPPYEQEADYVGLYIMARAGFALEGAPEVWRKMSAINPDAIYVASTHPSNPERFVSMHKTIAEIRDKQKRSLPLLPHMAQHNTDNTAQGAARSEGAWGSSPNARSALKKTKN